MLVFVHLISAMVLVMTMLTNHHHCPQARVAQLQQLQNAHRKYQQDNHQREAALTVSSVTNVEACSLAPQIILTVMCLMNQIHSSRTTASQERPVCGTPGKSQEAQHHL